MRRNLYFQTLIDGSFNSARVAAFLLDLLRQIPGKIIVVWDNGPMHRGPAIRELLKRFPRLTLANLPPYAPELNPVEQLWSHLKFGHCANLIPSDLNHLNETILDFLHSTKSNRNHLNAYWADTPLGQYIGNKSL